MRITHKDHQALVLRPTETHVGGGAPLEPPLELFTVQDWLFIFCPADSSSSSDYSAKHTLSSMSIAPLISKCLLLVEDEAETSLDAAAEQHSPLQVVREAVLGT
jgi:hypothetical protein